MKERLGEDQPLVFMSDFDDEQQVREREKSGFLPWLSLQHSSMDAISQGFWSVRDTEKTDESLFSSNESSPIDDRWSSGLPQFPSISNDRNRCRWRNRSLRQLHSNEEVFTWTKTKWKDRVFSSQMAKSKRRPIVADVCVLGSINGIWSIDCIIYLRPSDKNDASDTLRYPTEASFTHLPLQPVNLLASSAVALFFISWICLVTRKSRMQLTR